MEKAESLISKSNDDIEEDDINEDEVEEDTLSEIEYALSESIAGSYDSYEKEFDVFLAHNSADKPIIKYIANELRNRGLNPWLDVEQILPGDFFQDAIQKAIGQVKSAAIFISSNELSRWQLLELRAFISILIDEDLTVIPVLLPGGSIPNNLWFLKELNWVEFSEDYDEEAIELLIQGITKE